MFVDRPLYVLYIFHKIFAKSTHETTLRGVTIIQVET